MHMLQGDRDEVQPYDFGDLLDALGYRDGEHVAIAQFGTGRRTVIVTRGDADNAFAETDGDNVYFGISPQAGPARKGEKGTAGGVTRWAALHADLDAEKWDETNGYGIAETITEKLSTILGRPPRFRIMTGHGVQPFWPIADGGIDDDEKRSEIMELAARWHRLVAQVAAESDVKCDNVSNIDRVTRVPGTINMKNPDEPRPVTATGTGHTESITLAELRAVLVEHVAAEPERPAKGAPAVPVSVSASIDYDSLDGKRKAVADKYIRAAIDDWVTVAKAAASWPEGHRDSHGRGWQKLTADMAYRFSEFISAQWVSRTLKNELTDVYRSHALHPDADLIWRQQSRRAGAATPPRKFYETGGGSQRFDSKLDELHAGQVRMSLRLLSIHGDSIMFVPKIGWHAWTGKRWELDEFGLVNRYALDVVRDAIQEAHDGLAGKPGKKKEKRLKALLRDARSCESSPGLRGMLDVTSMDARVRVVVDELNGDPYKINVQNGTFDFRERKLLRHNPADRITKIANGAYRQDADASTWLQFLTTILPDEDVRGFVKRLHGIAVVGTVLEHILPIFTGTGANGKGTMYTAVLNALGGYGIAAEPELLMHREGAHPTGQMDLLGARLAIVSETERDRKLAESTMKRLTGGDKIKARYMRKDFVEFDPSHLAIMITNHLPVVHGDDPAVWRRIRIVPFNVVIPEEKRDKRLNEKLRDSADAILTWMIDGYAEYADAGDDLKEPESVTIATRGYKDQSDAVARFVDECQKSPNVSATTRQLFDAWEKFRNREGEDQISMKTFGQALDRLGYPATKSGSIRPRKGLMPPADDDTDFDTTEPRDAEAPPRTRDA
ncbi:DNA primase family protein [Rhodococcus zopfii]|uniref:DNA primase family protein n=1 Tax=Rhodococcus zopfii TaxID=43772 RepID=UPI001F0F9F3B|nr:phage/plasmid primase, P4 family [Rhodococcus zopfii]